MSQEEAPDKFAKLQEWHAAVLAAAEVKPIIENEQALRKEVVALFFPDAKEGSVNFPLEGGWALKAVCKLDRKVDEVALPAILNRLREEFQFNGDTLVRSKMELETKAYKALGTLNPEAVKVFDEALTIKPGSPTLELVPPKTAENTNG